MVMQFNLSIFLEFLMARFLCTCQDMKIFMKILTFFSMKKEEDMRKIIIAVVRVPVTYKVTSPLLN